MLDEHGHRPGGGGLKREEGYQRNRLKLILGVNFYLKEIKCLSYIGTSDLVVALFRNCVEVAVAGLASQHSGAGCLIPRTGESDMASAHYATHAGGSQDAHGPLQRTGLAKGGSFFMHQRVSACLESVSLCGCFP